MKKCKVSFNMTFSTADKAGLMFFLVKVAASTEFRLLLKGQSSVCRYFSLKTLHKLYLHVPLFSFEKIRDTDLFLRVLGWSFSAFNRKFADLNYYKASQIMARDS